MNSLMYESYLSHMIDNNRLIFYKSQPTFLDGSRRLEPVWLDIVAVICLQIPAPTAAMSI